MEDVQITAPDEASEPATLSVLSLTSTLNEAQSIVDEEADEREKTLETHNRVVNALLIYASTSKGSSVHLLSKVAGMSSVASQLG